MIESLAPLKAFSIASFVNKIFFWIFFLLFLWKSFLWYNTSWNKKNFSCGLQQLKIVITGKSQLPRVFDRLWKCFPYEYLNVTNIRFEHWISEICFSMKPGIRIFADSAQAEYCPTFHFPFVCAQAWQCIEEPS